MTEDAELLRRYSEEDSQEAFAALVRRHLDLVYGVALRKLGGDVHLAADVTQEIFTALARKASLLQRHPTLVGWLFTSTHFAATQVVRTESRRRAREQKAQAMNQLLQESEPAANWERLRPMLDDLMLELNERDRTAVLLRFFEGKSLAAVAAKIRLTEEGARSRIDRAVAKMQAMLAQRGVTSTGTALGIALGDQWATAAPAGLALTVTGKALASAVGTGGALGLPTFLHFMSTSKAIVGIACAVALLSVVISIYEAREIRERGAMLQAMEQQRNEAWAKLRELEQQLIAATRRAREADADTAELLATIERDARDERRQARAGSGALTHAAVQARYSQALEFARQGDGAAALKEFLWCFDDGMARVSTFRIARRGLLLDAMAKLGQRYPEALAVMRARRDEAEKSMLAGVFELDAIADFVALNRALGEISRTLLQYDRMPLDHARRDDMAVLAFEQLMQAQRYDDAARAKPYSRMESQFELAARDRPPPAGIRNLEEIRKNTRDFVVNGTANNIEVLAGAGDLAGAQTLAKKLLAYDSSEPTQAILQGRLTRAGRPELLHTLPVK